ncbi:DUF6603 domain-containing protein [Actinomycetospora rhizophila]|uniref:DUF6603 domain-containing protein n=1 Tax=Actinomycetospora rhizophila TaxID=1416876 RepID=A0ABV9ZKI8_9PSEU
MNRNVGEVLLAELRVLLEPLAEATRDESAREAFFAELGLDLTGLVALPVAQLEEVGAAVTATVEALAAVPVPPEDLADLQPLLAATARVPEAIAALAGLATGFPVLTPPLDTERLVRDALDVLVLRYLGQRAPIVLVVLRVLGLVRTRRAEERARYATAPDTARVVRFPQATEVVDLAAVGPLLRDPVAALRALYVPTEPPTARALAASLYPALDALLGTIGGAVLVVDPQRNDETTLGAAGALLASATALLALPPAPGASPDDPRSGLVVTVSPADAGDLGVVVMPVGRLSGEVEAAGWVVKSSIAASTASVALSPEGVYVSDDGAQITGGVRVGRGASADVLRLGGESGTRLEVGSVTLAVEVLLAAGAPGEITVLAEFGAARLAIAAGDGDGFVARLLPGGGVTVDADLAIGWSNRRGLFVRGSAALDVHLPVHVSFLGVLDVETLDLRVAVATPSTPSAPVVDLHVGVTARAHLGPLVASVEEIGARFGLGFPSAGGNAGPGELVPAFQPPLGALLDLDAGAVRGGGYVRADHAAGRYAGVLHVEIVDTLAVTAIGLVATRMPDGRPGFSLLVILTAAFPPLNIGFGFTLNGLGGLLGTNRGMNVAALRDAARTGALDGVLFPRDPVADAPRIVRDLEAMFPVAEGRFLIGLMAVLGWGTPTLVRAELGVVLEVPAPVRIALLGRASITLPAPDAAVVELHIDVVGVLDLGAREISVDASLHDSRIAAFAVTGDFALRVGFGAAPAFALSCGGFHPRALTPPGFPPLRRVAIALATSDNPRIRVEAYFAVTATSIQAGARLDVYAAKDLGKLIGRWSASAFLSFDALVLLEPRFSFVVDLAGGTSIRRNGKPVFSAELSLTLSGPQPWRAAGHASFEFMWATRRIAFAVTIGDEPPPPTLPFADPVADLVAALRAPGNWSAQVVRGTPEPVVLREVDDTDLLLVHPQGTLEVRQRVVPLGVRIDRYAGGPVRERDRLLGLTVTVAGAPTAGTDVREPFPAGQFFDLPEDQKIAGEAFPRLVHGRSQIALPTAAGRVPAAVDAGDEYETAVVNPTTGHLTRERRYRVPADVLDALVASGAAAAAPTRTTGDAAYAGPSRGTGVVEPRYVVVGKADLAAAPGAAEFASVREAEESGLGRGQQVVALHEAVRP